MKRIRIVLSIIIIVVTIGRIYHQFSHSDTPPKTWVNKCLQLRRDCIKQVEFESGSMKKYYLNLCEKFIDYCQFGCYTK